MFWLACEDLREEQNSERVCEKAQQIYDDYVSILSPKEVSHMTVISRSDSVRRHLLQRKKLTKKYAQCSALCQERRCYLANTKKKPSCR